MNGSTEQKDLGYLLAKVETFEVQLGEIRTEVTAIRTTLNIQKGSWRMLVALTSAAVTLGSVVTMIVEWIRGK